MILSVREKLEYGMLTPFFFGRDRDEAMRAAASSIRRRQGLEPADLAALGSPKDVQKKLQEHIDVGATKVFMRPSGPRRFLLGLVKILAKKNLPALQTPFREEERRNAGIEPMLALDRSRWLRAGLLSPFRHFQNSISGSMEEPLNPDSAVKAKTHAERYVELRNPS